MAFPLSPAAAVPLSPSGRLTPSARFWTVMAGALLAMALAALDQNIVNTALPRMAKDLGGVMEMSWIVTAFMLTSITTAPLYGKLSDIHGRRVLFFVAILVFLAGSLLCGLARSMGQMIAFRALQGLGAGGLLVLAQAAIGDIVPPRERPRYQGWLSGTLAVSSLAGPVLGGVVTSALSWRWVFLINLPIGALALALIAVGMRSPPPGRRRPIDFAGALLLTGATAAMLLLLTWGGIRFGWVSPPALGLAALVLALAGLFIWRQARAPEPLLRLVLFADPVFARGVGVCGLMAFAMLGSTAFLPLYFQFVLGMDPAVSGLMLLPQVAGTLLTSIVGGRAVTRLGRNKPFLLAGLALEVLALASLAGFAFLGAPAAVFLVSMGILGLGIGMGMPNLTSAVQNSVPQPELGAATGAMAFTRSLGSALGVATSGMILSARLASTSATAGTAGSLSRAALDSTALAYRTALTGCFLLSAVVMGVAFLLVLGLPEQLLRAELDGGQAA